MIEIEDIKGGFDIHMSGLSGYLSTFDCVEINNSVGHYVITELPGKNVVVVGNGDEISVAKHQSYFTVIFSGIVRTAMFVDPYGYGKHACHITSGYNSLANCLPLDYVTSVVDAEVLMAKSIDELDLTSDLRDQLVRTINEEYLHMLKLGGYNDDGQEAVDNKIKEIESRLA